MNTNTKENNSIKPITRPLSKVIRLPISKEVHEELIKEPNNLSSTKKKFKRVVTL